MGLHGQLEVGSGGAEVSKCRQEEGGAGRRELELPQASPRQLTSGLQGLNSWGLGFLPVTCDPAWAACPLPVKPQVTDAPCSLGLSLVTTEMLTFAHWP